MRATSAVTTIFILCFTATGAFAAVGDQMNMPGMNMPGMQQNTPSGKHATSSSMPGMQMPPSALPNPGMEMPERLALAREMFKSMTDHWLTINEMFNMGQANQMSLRQANIDLALQRTRVLAAQNSLDLAWQELTTVAGIDIPLATVAGALEIKVVQLTFNDLLTNLIEHSPEVGEAKEKLRSDQITVAREHRQPIPNLAVCGGPGYDQIDGGVVARAGLAVTNIPLWNRNQGTIQQAEADLTRQKAQIRLVELNLRRELAVHYNRFRTAGQFVQTYKDVVIPESRAKYEVALHSYKDVRMEWPDVLEAQRQYVEARLDYINHLVEYRESEIEIHGFLLSGGLVPPPGVTPPGHIDATPQPR